MKDEYEIIKTSDHTEYRLNGKLHREDGPAIEWNDGGGGGEWFFHDKRHREDGPAIILTYPGGYTYKAWYKHGIRHREDGPAIIDRGGNEFYYLDGVKYTYEEWLKELTKTVGSYIKAADIDPGIAAQIPEL